MRINETALRDIAHPAAADAAAPLVLSHLIDDANEKLKVAVAAESAAVEARTKAEDDLVAAQLASDAASHTPGANVYDAEIALEDAERKARVAGRVLVGSTNNREAAREAVIEAKVAAHVPVVKEGASRMVAAAKAIEGAVKALNDAFVSYRVGERMTHIAVQGGRGGDCNIQWLLDAAGEVCAPTAEQELAKWVTAGILEAAKVEG